LEGTVKQLRKLLRPLFVLLLCIPFLLTAFCLWFASTEPVGTVSVQIPHSDSRLEIHESVGFKTSRADFYLCPPLGRKHLLGSTEADERYCPFSGGDYRLIWLEQGVQVEYKFRGGSTQWSKAVFTWD